VSSAAESVATTVNNTRQSAAAWCNDHEEVVQAAIIGAAVVAATAVTVATAGAGAPLGAMIVGATVAGAMGAGTVTLARNSIDENRPWHEDLGESLQTGAAIGFGIGGIGATIAAAPTALAWGGQVGASTGVVASSLGASTGVASFAGSVASVAAPGGFLLGTGGFYGAASISLNPYFSPETRNRASNVALASGSLGMLSYFGGETLNAWGMQLQCAVPQIKPGSEGGPTAGRRFPESVRKEAFANDPTRTCVYCGHPGTGTQVDHAIPMSRGGNATIENAQLTCPWCNNSKGALDFPVNPPPGYEGPWPPPWW